MILTVLNEIYKKKHLKKEQSLEQFRKTHEKTVTLGHRLDLVFHQIRLGFFFHDFDIIKRNLDKAKT
jgi:26S proteasome regulatory subunit N7